MMRLVKLVDSKSISSRDGQSPAKGAYLQIHGRLTSRGTSNQRDAALMVHEREGEPDILFLASEDINQLRPVTIGEVLPSIGAGDTRIRLSTVMSLPLISHRT